MNFFFQAEDGIRDRNVTGVQTCALPISDINLQAMWDVVLGMKFGEAGYAYVVDKDGNLIAHPDLSLVLQRPDLSGLPQVKRSEERRVGKECRSRVTTYQ